MLRAGDRSSRGWETPHRSECSTLTLTLTACTFRWCWRDSPYLTRYHIFDDPDEDELPGVRGKENKFPLIDEQRRVRTPPAEGEGTEAGQRLLIDPCRDRPEAHLAFFPDGLVWARRAGAGFSRKRIESIKAYGLTRKELKEARRAHFLLLARTM